MLKFAANISTMYKEFDFVDRFRAAKEDGFQFVEMQYPYDYEPELLRSKSEGIKCVLINSYDDPNERNSACVPGDEVQFLNDLHRITPYYNSLGIQFVHVMSGIRNHKFSVEDQLEKLKENVNSAVGFLENYNVRGLIEPICLETKENYFLSNYDLAMEVLRHVNSDNLKLLLDIYHLHKITGNVRENLERYYPFTGHVQVSQDPGRTEPFYPGGKIDYTFVFDFLKEKEFKGVIGLEYFPSGSTRDSLDWMKKYV